MAKLDCNICLPDIDLYYDETLEIVEKNRRLLEIALRYPEGSKILNAGRVVVLRDGVISGFFAESAKNS
jgi:antiviral helicase SKI2